MGAHSWFRVPALLRSWHFFRNANFVQERGNAERERIGTLISRSCEEIKNTLAKSILLYTVLYNCMNCDQNYKYIFSILNPPLCVDRRGKYLARGPETMRRRAGKG